MKIHNLRIGPATNSSSSHSVVLIPGGVDRADSYDQEFGWDEFTLGTKESKLAYLGQTLKAALKSTGLSSEDAATLATAKLGNYGVTVDPNGYIDHQSVITLPTTKIHNGFAVNMQFVGHMAEFLSRDDIVVLGGNDNSGDDHPLESSTKRRFFREITETAPLRARFDERGQYWALQNRRDRSIVRVSMGEGDASRAEVPELVDLKITDQCQYGCYFCYQNSTPNGSHADKQRIENIISQLGKLGCFEVAIGGGDPVRHPQLLDILEGCSYSDIVPAISTRDVGWCQRHAKQLTQAGCAVGISCLSATELARMASLKDAGLTCVAHVVVGLDHERGLRETLMVARALGIQVLLLGWKSVGRAKKTPPWQFDINQLLGSIELLPKLSMDTVMVQQCGPWLAKNSHSWLWCREEGQHSMYIDAVAGTMAQSSYNGQAEPLSGLADGIAAAFRRWQET